MIQTAVVIPFPAKKKTAVKVAKVPITTPDNPLNMFKDAPFFEKLIESERLGLIVVKELKEICKKGSGNKSRNPLEAVSLTPLRLVKRRGRTLTEALLAAAEKCTGYNQMVLTQFGIQVMYVGLDGELGMGLDLRHTSRAEALFNRAGVPNWRTLVAQDCSRLIIKPLSGPHMAEAWAYFYIGGRKNAKRAPDEISPWND